ncbi:MAG TPA: hypothetical protein VEC14_07305 [Reyranellaceae bacterium]|nr:hypothetical protein [Reyranellaceae bacterium]
MSRGLSIGVATAIAGAVVPVAFFAEFQFASGTVRFWSGYGEKIWDGQTWNGAGELAGFSAVDETTEIGAAGMTFTLSGVPNALRALALADAYRNRLCKLWLAILDAAGNVTATYQAFGGRMDVLTLEAAGPTSTIALAAFNRLVDLHRARASRYTHAEQLRRFPGDLGCEFAAKLAEKPLWWGAAPPAAAAAPGGSAASHLLGNRSSLL